MRQGLTVDIGTDTKARDWTVDVEVDTWTRDWTVDVGETRDRN